MVGEVYEDFESKLGEEPLQALPQGDQKPESASQNPFLAKAAFFEKRIIEEVGDEKFLEIMRKTCEALQQREWPAGPQRNPP